MMEISSKTGGQVPTVIVHRNTEVPALKPVIVVLARFGEVIVPDPEIFVQVPLLAAVADI
jgi:hypothetical protein